MPLKSELQGRIKAQGEIIVKKQKEIESQRITIDNYQIAIDVCHKDIGALENTTELQKRTIEKQQGRINRLEEYEKELIETIEGLQRKNRLLSHELHEALNSDIKTGCFVDPIATEAMETAKIATKNHEAILKVNDRLVEQNGKLINVLDWMTKNNNDEY